MYAQTGPIGTITKDAYDRLTAEMFGMLRDRGPWDGVLISNHGAAVSEEHPDMDGAFTEAVRAIVGPGRAGRRDLDMHGNVSRRVVEATDVTVVWRTNPHLDAKPRGRKTAELVCRTAQRRDPAAPVDRDAAAGRQHPPPVHVRWTRCAALVADAEAANERPGILDTSVVEGYPYADAAQMGMSWIAIADGDLDAAREAAVWMAERGWARRAELNQPAPSIAEALDMARRALPRTDATRATSTR